MHAASGSSAATVGFPPRFRRPLERACCDQPDVVDKGGYHGEPKVSPLALDFLEETRD